MAAMYETFKQRVSPFFDAVSLKASKLLKVYVLSHVFTVTAENDLCGHIRFDLHIPDEVLMVKS